MRTVDLMIPMYEFNRVRTLGLLDKICQEPDPQRVLAWRPGPGRAHIGWQLMHIGVTEEIFATERLAPEKQRAFSDLWPRFRGGSTVDDNVPSPEKIRDVLHTARKNLLETLRQFDDSRLGEIHDELKKRKMPVHMVVNSRDTK